MENGKEGSAKPPPAGSNYLISLYPYTSTEPSDLQFADGVVIVQVQTQAMPDWLNGYLLSDTSCTVGMFPANYVRVLTQEEAAERQLPTIGSAPAAAVIGEPSAPTAISGFGSPVKTSADERKVSSGVGVASQSPKRVAQQVAAFETPTAAATAAASEQPADSAPTAPATRLLKKQEVATVIAAYTATSGEQLSLKPGQVVIVRSKADNGWWEGELQARGQKKQVGWFPASYVKIKASGRTTPDPVTAVTAADKDAARASHSASSTPLPSAAPVASAPTATGGDTPAADASKGAHLHIFCSSVS